MIKKFIWTPSLLARAFNAISYKYFFVNYDYDSKENISSGLNQVSIKITNVCNLRCKMCAQWGESGYNWGKPSEEIKEVVPVSTYKNIVDEVVKYKPFYYIWGGEPFLYPDIMELLNHITKKKCPIAIVTNGVKLKENAKELVEMGIDCLMLSLDGPKEVHNQIRGSDGCFDTLMAGIEEINKYKKMYKKKKPYVFMLSTISRDNAHLLDKTFDTVNGLDIDLLVVYYSWFTTKEIGEAHSAVFKRHLGCEAIAWKGWLNTFSKIDVDSLVNKVKEIKKKKYPFEYMFIPDLSDKDTATYYKNPSELFKFDKCISPWTTTEIMPNGDVTFCRDYPDFIIGNITKEPLLSIFNGEQAKKFRKALKDNGGLFPICSRCCGLMGW
jgi:radical SAM protein with 4Fe4S-binding SPASM domain